MPHTDGNSHDSSRLVVLSEERPRLSLEDLLEDSDSLREGKAKVRVHIVSGELTYSCEVVSCI